MHNTAYGPFVGFFNGCDHNYVLKSLSHKPSGALLINGNVDKG